MGMIVSTSVGLSNNVLSNLSRNDKQEKHSEITQKQVYVEHTERNNYNTQNAQQYVLMASTQITLSKSLQETLRYLNTHKNQTKKELKFGDLWKILNVDNKESEKNPYNGELVDFIIDNNMKNIFAA